MAMPNGEKAIEVAHDKVEGHYYYCYTIGQYALGCGVFEALRMGLGTKFEAHFPIVIKIDKTFDRLGILRLIGEYYYVLP